MYQRHAHPRSVKGRRSDRAAALSPSALRTTLGTKLKSPGAKGLPACAAQYATTAANLDVNSSTGASANIPPDPAFADFKSTQPLYDNPKKEVLLPLLGDKAVRYVLGAVGANG